MKEYGPPKFLREMTKEEKLIFGAKLVEARGRFSIVRDSLSREPELADIGVYDIQVFCDPRSDLAHIREESLTASDSEGYDADMRAAAIVRCRKLRKLMRELVNEQLLEIERKLQAL